MVFKCICSVVSCVFTAGHITRDLEDEYNAKVLDLLPVAVVAEVVVVLVVAEAIVVSSNGYSSNSRGIIHSISCCSKSNSSSIILLIVVVAMRIAWIPAVVNQDPIQLH
jgi:hypothetical protein